MVGSQKPGFSPKSWHPHQDQDYRRNPVSWTRRGGSETGFLSTISVMMQKLSQKPGFSAVMQSSRYTEASETGFLSTISAMMQKLSQKPGFSAVMQSSRYTEASETGFLSTISAMMQKLSQKPGFSAVTIELLVHRGLRNRVSFHNLGDDAEIIAETRFLCCDAEP